MSEKNERERKREACLYQLAAGVVLVLAIGALVLCAVAGQHKGELGWSDQRAFYEASVSLPTRAASATLIFSRPSSATESVPLSLDTGRESARLPMGRLGAAILRVEPEDRPGTTVDVHLVIIQRIWGIGAGLAGVVFFLALFYLVSAAVPEKGTFWRALAGPDGRMSLGRVQLLLWFGVSFGMLSALAAPLLTIPTIDASLAVLFGLSGLTSVIGAATPPKPGTERAKEPEARHLVETPGDGLDMTRVQCLALSVVGCIALAGAFVVKMRVPSIPEGFLGLIGVSQAAYLGTRAVTNARGGGST